MFLLDAIFLLVAAANIFAEDELLVKTSQGSLRGTLMETVNGRKIYAFKSIPFAYPPIGELRFEPPVPIEHWDGIYDASQEHPLCPQRNIYTRSEVIQGDEDCLYLNVYSPRPPNSSKKPLPVIIFFHGGGWLCGGGITDFYGPNHLLDKDIILVVPNYRLGPLGFLSTEDEVVPGNLGFKDQNLAMKWVKKNIGFFGGNPINVTLFGESAGGASSHYHMLSPMSKGLFQAAISQSGTALTTWALAPKSQALKQARKLASLVKCPIVDTREMVQCLKGVDAYKLIEQDKKFMSWDFDPMIPFKPVVEPEHEGAFLAKDPIDIIKSGKVADVPWILGLNSEDGALRAAAIFGHPHLIEELEEQFDRVVPISLEYDQTSKETDFVTKEIRKFYFDNKKVDNSSVLQVVDMYTDAWFLQGSDDAIRLHLKYTKNPVYYYLFSYRGTCSFTTIFGDPDNDYGVCHADELQYLFPINFCTGNLAEEDKPVVELLTTIWTNFASTGNPTPELNDVIRNKWKPVQTDEMEYFFLATKETSEMRKGLFIDRAKFWRDLPIDPRRVELVRDEL